MEVLRHQLMILKGEYPLVPFEEALDSWGGGFKDDSVVENKSLDSSETSLCALFIPLLLELVELENSHATAVAGCRARDGIKGRSIIPDYDLVNMVGAETLLDPTVKESRSQAEEIAKIVDRIMKKM